MKPRMDSKRRMLKTGEGVKNKEGQELYYFRWTDEFGKRRYVYSSSLTNLREKEKRIQSDKIDGIKYSGNTTINDLYKIWMKNKRGIKPNTFSNYRYMYETFVFPDFGKRKISTLKKSDVRRFYIQLIEQRNLKVHTTDCVHVVLYQVLQIAVDDNYLRSNPASNGMFELKKIKGDDIEKRKALTVEQQNLFCEELLKPENLYIRPLFLTMLDTGLRVGEATGLRWEDIDFENNFISVNHTLVYYATNGLKGHCMYTIHSPKTENSKRKVPMTKRLAEALKNMKECQDENNLSCEMIIDGYSGFVFFNRFGTVFNQGPLNKTIKRIQRDCNLSQIEHAKKENLSDVALLPNFTCHTLRHTCATRLCESGVNTRYIMEVLGHADIKTTMNIYVDVTKEFKEKESVKFENYVNQLSS